MDRQVVALQTLCQILFVFGQGDAVKKQAAETHYSSSTQWRYAARFAGYFCPEVAPAETKPARESRRLYGSGAHSVGGTKHKKGAVVPAPLKPTYTS
jgi:hypothetical protein